MKKFFVVAVFIAVAAFTFGQGMSIGGGIGWAPYWNTMRTAQGSQWIQAEEASSAFGAQIFFDATYIEASIGYFGSSSNYTAYLSNSAGSNLSTNVTNGPTGGWLSFAALGKYPFHLGGFTLFPLAGFEYDLNLSYTNKSAMSSEEQAYLNEFWFKFGVGADFPVSSMLYIRPTIIGGVKFLSQYEIDGINSDAALGYTDTISWFRLDVGVSVGYKL